MKASIQIRSTRGSFAAKRLGIDVTRSLLERLGQIMVDSFSKESKKDFAKRGWSGLAEDGSAPIWDSFSYQIQGSKTVLIMSTYPHLKAMTGQDTKPYRMTWLTQEAKEKKASHYPLTPREKKLGMKRGGRVSKGERLPLVVPFKNKAGTVVFRTAPLTFRDAWIHPGIARFTFVERAARKGREQCLAVIKQEVLSAVVREMSDG